MPGKSSGYVATKNAFAELKKAVIRENTIIGFGPYSNAAKKARQIKANISLKRRKLLFRFLSFFLLILHLGYFLAANECQLRRYRRIM